MARLDALRRLQAGEEGGEVERAEVGNDRMRHHARQVAAHRRPEADAEQAADGVEDAAVDERVAEAGDERRQAELAAGAQLVAVVVGVEVERGRQRRLAIGRGGELDRLPELVLVLRVGERRVLVEPLGGEHLGGVAEAFAAVVEADVDAKERLHALGDGDDAEAERQAQAKRLLERLDAEHLELRGERRCGGHRHMVSASLRSVQPALQVRGDERVVGEVGVLAADAVDLFAPGPGSGPRAGSRHQRALEQALAAQHLVAAGDAAVEVVRDVEEGGVAVGDRGCRARAGRRSTAPSAGVCAAALALQRSSSSTAPASTPTSGRAGRRESAASPARRRASAANGVIRSSTMWSSLPV